MVEALEQLDQQDQIKEKVSPDDELLQLKKDFAKDYFAKLQNESGSLPGLLLAETGTVEDYLTNEGVLDGIKDKVLLGLLLQKILEKETMDKLDEVKSKIDKISTTDVTKATEELNVLKKDVGLVSSEIPDASVIEKEQQKVDESINEVIENDNSPKQEKLIAILDKILVYDKNNAVKYNRGGRKSLKTGLDCSGLVIYALHQIGLKEMGGDSRDMFAKLETEKVEDNMNDIKSGDLLFWDSKNPKYKFSTGEIPTIKKDGDKYRIHHVAFVKEVDKSNDEITVVESNGSNGVVERKVSLAEEKKKKHKSDLFVGHVDYNNLLAYNGPKENILDQVA